MNSEDSIKPRKTLEVVMLCGELVVYSLILGVAHAVELAAHALPQRKKGFKSQSKPEKAPASTGQPTT